MINGVTVLTQGLYNILLVFCMMKFNKVNIWKPGVAGKLYNCVCEINLMLKENIHGKLVERGSQK